MTDVADIEIDETEWRHRPAGDPEGLVLRLAQKGWRQCEPARTLDEVQSGVQLCWVEINGVRTDAVIASSLRLGQGFQEVDVTFAGARVEVVYLGPDGEELGVDEAQPGLYSYETAVPRAGEDGQPPTVAWRAVAERHVEDPDVTGTLARALLTLLETSPAGGPALPSAPNAASPEAPQPERQGGP